MRKVTQQIKNAFDQGTSKKVGNTETDGKTVWLHGNAIVKRDPDGLVRWSLAGWNTPTTRERGPGGGADDRRHPWGSGRSGSNWRAPNGTVIL